MFIQPYLFNFMDGHMTQQYHGLHITVRNTQTSRGQSGPGLPGSGAGLLGLRERVDLAGGTLVHGPDGLGDFVVQADLPW